MIKWENGEITTQSLAAANDPITCAIYARDHALLMIAGWKCFNGITKCVRDNVLLMIPGWKHFNGITNCEKKFLGMANQASLCSYCTSLKFASDTFKDIPFNRVYSSIVLADCLANMGFAPSKSEAHTWMHMNGEITWMHKNGEIQPYAKLRKRHAKLRKHHKALSFHRVREAIASKVISFHHIPGVINPADVLSKHWGYQQVW